MLEDLTIPLTEDDAEHPSAWLKMGMRFGSFCWLKTKSPGRLHLWKKNQKAGGGRNLISVGKEFRINKSLISSVWKAFQTKSPAVIKVGGGRSRKKITVDDRYIVLQVIRARYQSESSIVQQLCTARGREVSRFAVTSCLHKGDLFARRSERCIPLKGSSTVPF
ncbi:transposable element Tcb2 transposase [Trichonephila clavipes]|nr:transposable element Tcb2 transposase [Trichonephila clavipes]